MKGSAPEPGARETSRRTAPARLAKESAEPSDRQADQGEAELVLAAIRGDDGASERLVARYRNLAVRIAWRYAGSQNAEDVAQDALILALRSLNTLDDPAKFASWLVTIVRRRALRAQTESARRLGLDGAAAQNAVPYSNPDEPLLKDLRATLKQLPREFAEALGLHSLQGVPLKQVSHLTGVPVATVKWRIHRGKQLLREHLKPRKGAVQGAGLDWIRLALQCVPAKIRRVMFEHALDGLSVSEIALSHKVSEALVEQWVVLGRKIFREELIRLSRELERRMSDRRRLVPCETCPVPKACLSSACPLVQGGLLKRRSGVLQNAHVFLP